MFGIVRKSLDVEAWKKNMEVKKRSKNVHNPHFLAYYLSGCNNLQGLSSRDNILWMIVVSKSHIWPKSSQVVVVTL